MRRVGGVLLETMFRIDSIFERELDVGHVRRKDHITEAIARSAVLNEVLHTVPLLSRVLYDATEATRAFVDLRVSLDAGSAALATGFLVEWRSGESNSAWRTYGEFDISAWRVEDVLRALPPRRVRLFFKNHGSRADEAALVASGIVPFDQLSSLDRAVDEGSSIELRVRVTSKRFPRGEIHTTVASVPLPSSWDPPEGLNTASGAVEIVNQVPSFADSGMPVQWDATKGRASLDTNGVFARRSLYAEGRVLVTLAGLRDRNGGVSEFDPLVGVQSMLPAVFVRVKRVADSAKTPWLDGNTVALRHAASGTGEGCLESLATSTVCARIVSLPVSFCNARVEVEVVVGALNKFTIRDVWVEPYVRRPEEHVSNREAFRSLFKRAFGVADTHEAVHPRQEVRGSGELVLSQRAFMVTVPTSPTLDATSDDDPIIEVREHAALSPIAGSARHAWADASGWLIDAIQPTFSEFYMNVFSVEVQVPSTGAWVDVWRSNIGALALEPGAGLIRFFDASALDMVDPHFSDASHAPSVRASFARYIGPKLSDLIEDDSGAHSAFLYAAPWAVSGTTVASSSSATIRWDGVDANYLPSTTTIASSIERVPFVLKQTVRWTDGEEEGTYSVSGSSLITSIVFDRTLDGVEVDGTITADMDTSGVLTIRTRRPMAKSITLIDVENANGIGTTAWADESVTETFAGPDATLAIDGIAITTSGPSAALAQISHSGAIFIDASLQIANAGGGLPFGVDPDPTLMSASADAFVLGSLVASRSYDVSASVRDQFGEAHASVTSFTFVPPTIEAIPLLASPFSIEAVGPSATALKLASGDKVHAVYGSTQDVRVRIGSGASVRVHNEAITSPSSVVRFQVDASSIDLVYSAATGSWGSDSLDLSCEIVDGATGVLPMTFVSISGSFPMTGPIALGEDSWREISASVVVVDELRTSDVLRIARVSNFDPPAVAMASLEADVSSIAIGGRQIVRSLTLTASDVCFGIVFRSDETVARVAGLVPEGAGDVPQDLSSLGAVWASASIASEALWGATAWSGTEASVVATFSNAWGDASMAATLADRFVDNPSAAALPLWSARKLASISGEDLETVEISGGFATENTFLTTSPIDTSLLLRGGALVSDAGGSELQGFVWRAMEDSSAFGATLKLSIDGPVGGPRIPNLLDDSSDNQIFVFVSASSDGVAGLDWADANQLASFEGEGEWWDGRTRLPCLAPGEASTNATRFIVLPAAFNAAKTVDVAIIVKRSFAHGISGIMIDTFT